jgi:hypothetical protein
MSRLESLLGQGGGEPEATRERHPDGSWRADALGRSRHARLTEHLRQPLDDCDPDKARRLCAAVCRDLLADFAPALLRVAAAERFRCQVLATWLRSLFDFAGEGGIEGERLASLNRLEFTLDQALAGDVQGQPAYVGMALEERRRPWPRPALDALMVAARRRIVAPRLATAEQLEADALALSAAVGTALLGAEPDRSPDGGVVTLGAGVLRLRALLDLGPALRRHRAGLPLDELPARDDPRQPLDRRALDAAVRAELGRIRPALAGSASLAAAPVAYRGALRYLRLAARALAERIERQGWEVVSAPPSLGLGARLALLARSFVPRS